MVIMISENIQLRKKASDSFRLESEDEYKVFFISPQDLHGRNSKGPYNIISHDSIGIHHFRCIALVYMLFFKFILLISSLIK